MLFINQFLVCFCLSKRSSGGRNFTPSIPCGRFKSYLYAWNEQGFQTQSSEKIITFVFCSADEAELQIGDCNHLMTVLGAWASMLAFLSQDCS